MKKVQFGLILRIWSFSQKLIFLMCMIRRDVGAYRKKCYRGTLFHFIQTLIVVTMLLIFNLQNQFIDK